MPPEDPPEKTKLLDLFKLFSHSFTDVIKPSMKAFKYYPECDPNDPFIKEEFQAATSLDPVLPYIIPSSSLLVAYKKLPNLQLLLCKNDQNALIDFSPQLLP